ncbi:acyl-CoA dehydrogenase family protein [Salinactinospora qingdaonensis]|uniref:Acyl-CoA dehydrogenase family protein n=1 Tax=Salinactinospora qingdaonensis TaxID=702744 RepID=A0ABP7F784_9ACTN
MAVIWGPTFDEDEAAWVARARELARSRFAPLAAELDRDQRYPWENVAALNESGLAGLLVPTEYGGAGGSLTLVCGVIEVISTACASTGAILNACALGAYPLLLAGTPQQREHYLGGMTAGRAVSFALTEEGVGSDAAAIRATAEPEGEGYRLRGEKIYIGNGGASQTYVVFARTDPEAGSRGITAFLVDKDAPGVVIDHYEDKMGIRGTLTSNLKLDTHVPRDSVLGEPGRGLKLALQTLNAGRISVAAQSTGLGLAAYETASAEAVRRATFGRPIIDNQGISFPLADVATDLTAARMLTFTAARAFDAGDAAATLGAMAKLHASEAAHRAADVAVQVHGGAGYCKPNLAERLYRDQRILQIYEGSSEIQRLVIGRAVADEAALR